jgi:hypothetical protein
MPNRVFGYQVTDKGKKVLGIFWSHQEVACLFTLSRKVPDGYIDKSFQMAARKGSMESH